MPTVASGLQSLTVAPIVHEAVSARGQALGDATRAKMEARLGRDLGDVRIHDDQTAARSAGALGASAYAVGTDVVFGAGAYQPDTAAGDRLLAHELTHVVQQGTRVATRPFDPVLLDGGGNGEQRLRVAPPIEPSAAHERNASATFVPGTAREGTLPLGRPAVQPFELPFPAPICGAMVTDIDVLPARPRPLVECGLPPTLMVTRINIVGRARSPASTGRGRIVFNLHVGYYRDPATGRLCAVISDSIRCLTPSGCIHLGCFPTLTEVLEAIGSALKSLLKILGIIALAILIAIILRGLRNLPGGAPAPVMATGSDGQPDGGGATAEPFSEGAAA